MSSSQRRRQTAVLPSRQERAWARVWHGLVCAAAFMLATGGLPAQAKQAAAQETPHYAFTLKGKVVSVADGDTLTLLVGKRREKVRLASIDAPEIKKDGARLGQDMAQQSRKALADLLASQTVIAQCFEQDRYQRNICDVMLPDGSSANQRQVAAGMAWANMEKRGRFLRDASLPALERRARRDRLGIWQRSDAIAPWVWRYQCWQLGQCS